MSSITLSMLESFPNLLEQLFAEIPPSCRNWSPESLQGIPGESFTAIEHICHLRDIEIDGYQVRLGRLLAETMPTLESIDGFALAELRQYSKADPATVLPEFREARRETLARVRGLSTEQLQRPGHFEGYGNLTVQGLLHYLCSHDQQHLSGLHWLLGKIRSS